VLNALTRDANLGRAPEELLARGLDLLMRAAGATLGIGLLLSGRDDAPLAILSRGFRPTMARAVEAEFRLRPPRDPQTVPIDGLTVPPRARDLLVSAGARQAVVVPLRSERGLAGVLVGLARDGASPVRSRPLGAIARQLGAAIGNALEREGLRTANTDRLRLLTLVRILAEPRTLEDTLTTVAQAARTFARAAAVAVWLADHTRRRLSRIVLVESRPDGPADPRRSLAWGEDLAGWVADTGQAGIVHDAARDPRVDSREWIRDRGLASLYGFPLRFEGTLVGVLTIGADRSLPASRLALLEAFADHAALAIGQADLRRQLEIERARRNPPGPDDVGAPDPT
jgi:GAF domain-containing protein